LRNNKPDILFLDIVLDVGSGFDILEEIDSEDI
jgi:DNA-binding response OmpR family regulator